MTQRYKRRSANSNLQKVEVEVVILAVEVSNPISTLNLSKTS